MKNLFYPGLLLLACVSRAQSYEGQQINEQQLENLAEKKDANIEDDSYWQNLETYRRHPINLNRADEDDLRSLGILTDLQVKNFFLYKQLLGKLITVYELQAVPAWDLETIRQLLPFIVVSDEGLLTETFRRRWKNGDNTSLIKVSQTLEKSKGFKKPADTSSSYYMGSPQQVSFRYIYNYKNLLQYGILGDKDAGEQFFRGSQRYGFDFYSFHFFTKKNGIIRSLAIGDFTINMGQGLIQWQSLAFTKSSGVLAIKRQAEILRPYHSTGEFNFHRGAGITLYKKPWQATGFISIKNISTNISPDTSDVQGQVSSFESSGYHRTQSENDDRNNTKQFAFGGNINLMLAKGHIGVNMIHYQFSKPIQKQDRPYNLFAISGKSWSNYSLDYSYTFRNVHVFGEMAMDKDINFAFVDGALISLSSTIDASVLYRNISQRYQSLYADAFTENTNPNNEKGFYAGITTRPFAGWRLDAFFDTYNFPWLKYGVDAPSRGRDFFVQVFYQPSKNWSLYSLFKNKSKQENISGLGLATHPLAFVPQQDWRTGLTVSINNKISIRERVEYVWYNKKVPDAERGFLGLIDILYHAGPKSYSGNLRLQYFETNGYNSRIYVFENDVLYSYSLYPYADKGFRYYINISGEPARIFHVTHPKKIKWQVWLRWAQTIYAGKTTIGTGLDQITGNKKTDIRLQVSCAW